MQKNTVCIDHSDPQAASQAPPRKYNSLEEMQAGEAEAEEWVPTKAKARRTAGAKKKGKAFKAALGVVKGPGAPVVKKTGDQGVKKRAAKRAPFKGVTIKNNRCVTLENPLFSKVLTSLLRLLCSQCQTSI